MRATVATLGLAALAAANPMPQAVTSAIDPKTTAPAGCQATYPGTFEIQVVNVTSSSKVKRDTVLMLTLNGGILKDAFGRTGYIASNNQFQFDGPPQAGAIYTAGWSVCPNSTLALGGQTSFFQCLSGSFYNLYDTSTGAQCSPVYIEVINDGSGAATTSVVSQYTDGQPQETPVPTPICEYTDGQPQATQCAPVSEYTDGQPQAPTGTPVSEYTDGQPQAPTGTPVSEYTDGQPQAPTGTPVSEYTDGQPQAPTGTPVSEYTDGQPQAPTGTPVSEYTDGQPQAPTGTPVSEYTDGQPQAPTGTPVSEYTDGQPQAATATPVSETSDGQIQAATQTATTAAYQNAAPVATQGVMGVAAAVLAVLAL